jgi:hypothetical protein
MLKWYLEEFWWLLVLIAIVIVMIAVALVVGPNGNEFDIVSWTINPANPSSPVHQIMP